MLKAMRVVLTIASLTISSWIVYNVVWHERFAALPGGRTTGVFCVLMSAIMAVWAIHHRNIGRLARALAILPMIGLLARYYVPPHSGFRLSHQATQAQALLRVLASSQEEYRIRAGRYASSLDDLSLAYDEALQQQRVTISSEGDKWWRGSVEYPGGHCEIHVGFPDSLHPTSYQGEGIPQCGENVVRGAHQAVSGARFSGQPSLSNISLDTSGSWPQHRANSQRTGIVDRPGNAYRWDAWVSGEVRASASVAGNQVFVGAHGNGEVAALSLKTGALLWRARAPNWIHHEPVVAGRFVAYGFGNNEITPPAGFDVRDRGTGALLWRRFTPSGSMGAPLIEDGKLIGLDLSGSAYAWDLTSGKELWKYLLPLTDPLKRPMPMSNPLLVDSLVAVSMERTAICFIQLSSGRQEYCRNFSGNYWGGGHSSPAFSGTLVVLTGKIKHPPLYWWSRVTGLSFPHLSLQSIASVSLLAVEVTTGQLIWELRLSGPAQPVNGHVAGTPVIEGPYTIVPLPSIGEVVSLATATGQTHWRSQVSPARGSVTVLAGRVFVATSKSSWVVLDLTSGNVICSAPLPGRVDRAGLAVAGNTGVMTFLDGRVTAAPLQEWLSCSVRWPSISVESM